MIQKVIINIICDNNSVIGEQFGNSGYSVIIECKTTNNNVTKYLFDTGVSADVLQRNLTELKIDLSDVKHIILSHGHFDHTGGLTHALKQCHKDVIVYCHPDTLIEKVLNPNKENEMSVGITATNDIEELTKKYSFITSVDKFNIDENIWLTGQIDKTNNLEKISGHLLSVVKKVNHCEVFDNISEDISLVINMVNNEKIIICGCCHSGIVNTTDHVKKISDNNIVGIVGGLQLHQASKELLLFTNRELNKLPLKIIYPLHSSGDLGFNSLNEEMPKICNSGGVGTQINI
ncbi:MAG: MBL fold metallo-hydrolase [Spirochaetaceae bacterium]